MEVEDVPAGPLLLDTDVFSWATTRNRAGDRFEPFLENRALHICFVTVAELWHGAVHAGWGESRRSDLQLRIAQTSVIYPDVRVAHQWGEIYSRFRDQLSGKTEAHDMWIAASALVFHLPLVTNNLSDFRVMADHFPLDLVHPDL